MDTFKNITVKIDDAEGYIDDVAYVTKQDYTNKLNEVSNLLSRLFRPDEPGYNKVYILVKDNEKELRVRRDLSRTEDTPASIILELIQHDKDLEKVVA